MEARMTKQKLIGKAIVRDEISLTTYNDQNQTKITFEALKKQGRDVKFIDGVLIEKYPEMKKEQIAEKLIGEIKILKDKLNKVMKIKYNQQLIKA
jgi:hypothetical protein